MTLDPQDENLGIRLHEVNRERAVERAVERMRYALNSDWHYLTTDDHDTLRWITGELWATTTRAEWETFRFSKLDRASVQRLISVGDRLRRHRTGGAAALENAANIVRPESVGPYSDQVFEETRVYLT